MSAGGRAVFENLGLVVGVDFLVDAPGGAFGCSCEVGVTFAVVALSDAVLDAAPRDLASDNGAFVFG